MNQENFQTIRQAGPSVAGSYFKMVFAVLVGAGLGLGIYFLTGANTQANPGTGTATADSVCVCPSCGMTVPKPPNMDCEELNCPNCGHAMANGARLAAVAPNPGGVAQAAPVAMDDG